MTEVLYICLWYKDKKRTWSGTAWSLRQAMEPYLQGMNPSLYYTVSRLVKFCM